MLQFYTGGLESSIPDISMRSISTICSIIKAHYYERALKTAVDNFELSTGTASVRTYKSGGSVALSQKANDRPKSTVKIGGEETTEAVIKRKILENKESNWAVIQKQRPWSM